MCAHYENIRDPRVIREHFKAEPLHPDRAAEVKQDVWPGYTGTFIVRPPEADHGDEAVASRIAMPGVFGLLPHWAKDDKFARHTYNARSETVAEKPSFRDAWRKARHCIIPAQAIYEPDWRSGKSVPTRITRADGQALGIAGLWDAWRSPQGNWVHSYTMLTINADGHPFMNRFHKPGDEKRMVVVLPEDQYGAWLEASADDARRFIQAYPAEGFGACAASSVPRRI
ncbi:MAG: SOS response-associated peptidase [Betaproteobacteria bacterium]|jgi:putative SOS response-associated peptidase YedK